MNKKKASWKFYSTGEVGGGQLLIDEHAILIHMKDIV